MIGLLFVLLSLALFVLLWRRFDRRQRVALTICYVVAIPSLFMGLNWLAPAIVVGGLAIGWAFDRDSPPPR